MKSLACFERVFHIASIMNDKLRESTIEVVFSLANFIHDLFVCAAREGRASTQQDIHDDSNAPHIAHLVVASSEDLRGDVVGCPQHQLHLLILRKELRSAEVNELDVVLVLIVN